MDNARSVVIAIKRLVLAHTTDFMVCGAIELMSQHFLVEAKQQGWQPFVPLDEDLAARLLLRDWIFEAKLILDTRIKTMSPEQQQAEKNEIDLNTSWVQAFETLVLSWKMPASTIPKAIYLTKVQVRKF